MKIHHTLLLIGLFVTCSYQSLKAQSIDVTHKKDSLSTYSILNNTILDSELAMVITKFKKKGVLLSITNIKRNKEHKITGIDIKANTVQGELKADFSKNSQTPIKPIAIEYDTQKLNIQYLEPSDINTHKFSTLKFNDPKINNDSINFTKEIQLTTSNKQVKQPKNSHKIFINNNPDTITTIIVNGKIVTEDELNKMDPNDIVTIEVRSVRKTNVQKLNEQKHQYTDKITEENL
ncbi:hypothetical protein MWU59_01160 [Flavobacteriaceae bacterium F08102]|nr:hypothetical protein [Flavobacteriaceae bacterium F08102]